MWLVTSDSRVSRKLGSEINYNWVRTRFSNQHVNWHPIVIIECKKICLETRWCRSRNQGEEERGLAQL